MTRAFNLADAHAPAFPDNYRIIQSIVLNRTCLEAKNNKFYVLEIHESSGQYRLFTNYGRVGAEGIKEARYADCQNEALAEFSSLLKSKTNPRKGYIPVEVERVMVGSAALKAASEASASQTRGVKPSQLHPEVACFIEQIYEETTSELARRIETPLGCLSKVQIERGTQALQAIRFAIARGHQDMITPLTSQYYTLVPHRLGRWTDIDEVTINTAEKADREEELLQLMRDVYHVQGDLEADVDRKYQTLGAQIQVLTPTDKEYRQAAKQVLRTQSHRHGFQVKIHRIFRVCLPDERRRFEHAGQAIGNVRRLFHGTRSSNMVGILSRGLLIAPKSAPVTGYMFGKGVYFADQSTKSAQYSLRCVPSRTSKSSFLFLADVALGQIKKEAGPCYRETAPEGFDSVQGCKGTCLLHNEFIIYRTAQCTLRYIVEIEQA